MAGDPVPEPDVAQLAGKLQRGCAKEQRILAGWYDPTDGVQYPYDVLVAQEQNLGWDARLRRRYAALILAAALVWSALGLIAGMLIADAMIINTLLSSLSPRWPSTRSRSRYGRASSG